MVNLKYILFLLCIFLSAQGFSQRKFKHDKYNRLGIQGGMIYGGINSEDFNTSRGLGFTAGLTTRANVHKGFLMVYGVNFYRFNTNIMLVGPETSVTQEVEFKATGVQLNLFAGHKIIKEHLSLFAGPVLQLNGEWTPDETYKDYRVEGYNIEAIDLEGISKLNFNAAAALNMGFKSFKIWLQYQYGLNNILENLNSPELEEKDSRATNLHGRMEFATAGIIFYF